VLVVVRLLCFPVFLLICPEHCPCQNDDGPPSEQESPFIKSFLAALRKTLGWEVHVVLPSSQKSWIGNGFEIKKVIDGTYYDPDTGAEDTTNPSSENDYVLFDATPATCANIALHNLYPGEIDLVIAGPNYGRNVSTALTFSRYAVALSEQHPLKMLNCQLWNNTLAGPSLLLPPRP
jgi:5'/3'-nucleotidase SurE